MNLPPDGTPALRLVGLLKRFGETTAVDHLDLEVPGGSFFGLVGPNGAGKTTSLSMAVGLPPAAWAGLLPAVAFDLPAALPWVGPATALIVAMGAANVYGDEGTALWLTRMVPGVEGADVRGRQLAWLLVVAPVTVLLTAVLTVLGGQGWAGPWVLAVLPAVLGGTAGLMLWLSVARPVRQKDPQRRAGPFDTGDDPNAASALVGQQYLMLLLAALVAVTAATLAFLGTARPAGPPGGGGARRGRHRRAAVLVGRAPGRPAAGRPRRRAHGPAPPRPGPDRLQPVRGRPPGQGLVRGPLPPPSMQVPVAAAFVVGGVLALWWAAVIQRAPAGEP